MIRIIDKIKFAKGTNFAPLRNFVGILHFMDDSASVKTLNSVVMMENNEFFLDNYYYSSEARLQK